MPELLDSLLDEGKLDEGLEPDSMGTLEEEMAPLEKGEESAMEAELAVFLEGNGAIGEAFVPEPTKLLEGRPNPVDAALFAELLTAIPFERLDNGEFEEELMPVPTKLVEIRPEPAKTVDFSKVFELDPPVVRGGLTEPDPLEIIEDGPITLDEGNFEEGAELALLKMLDAGPEPFETEDLMEAVEPATPESLDVGDEPPTKDDAVEAIDSELLEEDTGPVDSGTERLDTKDTCDDDELGPSLAVPVSASVPATNTS